MSSSVVKGATVLFLIIVAGVIVLFVVMHGRNNAEDAVKKEEAEAPAPPPRVPTPADVEKLEAKTDLASGTGLPTLVVTGSVRCSGLWLGMTVMPRTPGEPGKDTKNFVFELAQGPFHETAKLDKSFAGGCYAVAVWNTKTEKSKCKRGGGDLPCQWCGANGYHMDGFLAGRDGQIGGGPTVSLDMKVERNAESGEPLSLEISGELGGVDSDCLLGISVYPKECVDLLKDGKHEVKTVQKGKFSTKATLGEPYAGGWFETALWERKVKALDCKTKQCFACKNSGYHLEGMLAYRSDAIRDMQRARMVVTITPLAEDESKENLCTLDVDAEVLVKNVKAYLGYSIYPRGIGPHDDTINRLLPDASTTHSTSVKAPAKMSGGTFEVALWRTKVEKANCKREFCPSCQTAGYHLEGLLAFERVVLPK